MYPRDNYLYKKMLTYNELADLFREISMKLYMYNGYALDSFVVAGLVRLAVLIDTGLFPAENCHWVAKSIVPNISAYTSLMDIIEQRFDVGPTSIMYSLLDQLCIISLDYQPEREGIPNPEFRRIFSTPEEEFTTFFSSNIENIDDFDNDSHREILSHGGTLDDSDSDSDLEVIYDSDYDSEDDFIDPENPPEYSQYSEPPPKYEERNRDVLLDAGVPLYSEFSWIRAMLFRVESFT
jgi:hypothetical protein